MNCFLLFNAILFLLIPFALSAHVPDDSLGKSYASALGSGFGDVTLDFPPCVQKCTYGCYGCRDPSSPCMDFPTIDFLKSPDFSHNYGVYAMPLRGYVYWVVDFGLLLNKMWFL